MPADTNLKFGVELEFFFVSDEPKKRFLAEREDQDEVLPSDNWAVMEIAKQYVSEKLDDAGIKNQAHGGRAAKSAEAYEKWSVKYEFLVGHESDNEYTMELASKIYELDEHRQQWEDDLRTIFATIVNPAEGRDIRIKKSNCDTHVHISPADGPWKLAQLQEVAKAAVYYERCIDVVVTRPGLRTNKSNHASVHYQTEMKKPSSEAALKEMVQSYIPKANVNVVKAWAAIDAVENIEQLAHLMCKKPWYKKDGLECSRYFYWNFKPLIEKKSSRGTIEFRMQVGAKTAEEAIARTLFPLGIVEAALVHTKTFDPTVIAAMPEFEDFVNHGVELCGYNKRDVAPVFANRLHHKPSFIYFAPDGAYTNRVDKDGNEIRDEFSSGEEDFYTQQH